MKYIKIETNENGSHNNQFGGIINEEGWAIIPEDMIIPSTFPFVDIEVENGIVISMVEKSLPLPSVLSVQQNKIQEMSIECHNVIINGIQIGNDKYSLEIEDQLNMMSLMDNIKNGATQVPYHANGQDCRFYTDVEFMNIVNIATKHKIFHESYYNSLRNYIYHLEDREEINNIYYGIEIPEEYQTEVLKELLSE